MVFFSRRTLNSASNAARSVLEPFAPLSWSLPLWWTNKIVASVFALRISQPWINAPMSLAAFSSLPPKHLASVSSSINLIGSWLLFLITLIVSSNWFKLSRQVGNTGHSIRTKLLTGCPSLYFFSHVLILLGTLIQPSQPNKSPFLVKLFYLSNFIPVATRQTQSIAKNDL